MAKKKRELKVHGQLLGSGPITQSLLRVKGFLDSLPVDVVYSLEAISKKLGVSLNYLQTNVKRMLGEDYRYKDGVTFAYGNKETVRLKKEGFYDREEELED